MSFGTEFIDIPLKTRKGGKDNKMSKVTAPAEVKAAKKYTKTRGEHFKDVLIAVLITAVVAFIAGTVYANKQHAATDRAVSAATAQAEAVKK